jgi:hypothetical protein
MAVLRPLARHGYQHVACGSLRRLQIHAHAIESCDLAASRQPARFTSPGSSRVVDLPALFHAGSSMGTRPSEVSPRSSPPDPLGSCRPPCRFPPPVKVLPRLRGFELSSVRHALLRASTHRTDAFSDVGVVHAYEGSLLSWSFPPFEDDLPASSDTSAEHPLMGFYHACEPRLPLRFIPACLHVRSSEFQRSGSLTRVTEPPSMGFLSPPPSP